MKNILQKFWESITRIFFLTLFMTAIVTYWKLWYNSDFYMNWFKTWSLVFLIAFSTMCFLIRPFILDKLHLEGYPRQIVWMFLLVILFTFIFSNRFDHTLDIITLVKNFWILTLIVFPVGLLLAWPLSASLAKKYIKK